MKNIAAVCFICALMMLPATVWAGQPLGVEDTKTEGKGNMLLEMNGEYIKDASVKTTKLTGIITSGLGEHTDLSLEVPYLMLNPSTETGSDASGKGDVRLKLKHQIFENEVKQSLAYEVYGDFPTGDSSKGLGTNNVVWGFMLVDTQECHDCAYHVNVGYELYGRDMKDGHFTRNYAVYAGLAAEHAITSSFRFVTQIKAESRKQVVKVDDAYLYAYPFLVPLDQKTEVYSRPVTLMAGFIYDITKTWYVDFGLRAGLNSYAEDISVLAGTALRF